MKKITVNGKMYLGNLIISNDTITVNRAMPYSSTKTSKENFINYLQMWNAGELTAETFGGQGISYSVTDLTDSQELELKICRLTMAYAKKTTASGLENDVFGSLLGKP